MARIVVVEDEPDLRELLVEERTEMGHDIAVAGNGEEGLNVILQQTPDLILADINMPKLNGRELRGRLLVKKQEAVVTDKIKALRDQSQITLAPELASSFGSGSS